MAAGAPAAKNREISPKNHETAPFFPDLPTFLTHLNGKGGKMKSCVDRVMAKRKMSKGGEVANGGDDDLELLADSSPAEFDDLALRDGLESENTGATAGDELGDAQESKDRKDTVARVMKARASRKQSNPRPA